MMRFSVEDLEIDEKTMEIKAIINSLREKVYAKKYIITTGTFLRGMIHIGRKSYPGWKASQR